MAKAKAKAAARGRGKAKARSAPAKPKAQGAGKAPKRALDLQSTLSNKQVAKRKQLDRRDSEDKTIRVLENHFSDIDPVELYSVTAEDLTLPQRLRRDISALGDDERLSKNYRQTIRSLYNFTDIREVPLPVPDKSGTLGDDFASAMKVAGSNDSSVRSVALLRSVFRTRKQLTQREFAGFCVSVELLIKAGNSKASLDTLYIVAVECVCRLQKVEEFQDCIVFLKPRLDGAMMSLWRRCKRGGVSLKTFMATHRQKLGILIPEGDLAALLDAKGDFQTVRVQVDNIIRACGLAVEMFQDLQVQIAVNTFSAGVALIVDQHVVKGVTPQIIEECEVAVQAEVDKAPQCLLTLTTLREATVQFCGKPIKVPLGALPEDGLFALRSAVKTKLVKEDATFTKLLHEKWLFPTPAKGSKVEVPMEMRESFENARKTFKDLLGDVERPTMKHMINVASSEADVMEASDETWKLECYFLAHHGEQALKAVDAIKQIFDSDAFAAAEATTQQELRTAQKVVTSLHGKTGPKVGGQEGSFLAQVLSSSAWFFSAQMEDKGRQKTMRGRAGVRTYWDALATSHTKKKLTLQDLDPVMPFVYLLEPDKRQACMDIQKECFKRAGISGPAASSSSTPPSKASKGGSASSKEASKAAATDIMSVFG